MFVSISRGPAAECRGSGNEHVRSGIDRLRRGLGIDPAIDLEANVKSLLGDALGDRLDLAELAGDELLSAETRIDAHHQHEIDVLEHIIERLGRRRRVERHAGLLAERLDPLDRAVEVRAGLRMDGDDVGPGLGECVEERVDRRNHQMHVERLCGVRPERLHHARADGDVGHEMAIHHVDVDPVGARLVDRAHFLAQLGEVGGKDGRGDQRSGIGPIRRDQARADKPRHEEAVEAALRLQQAGQDADPALRAMATRSPGSSPGLGGSIVKSEPDSRNAGTTSSPSCGSSEQTE